MTFETFDQSDEETGPDQKNGNDKDKYKEKHNDKDKYIQRAPSRSNPRDLWPLRHLIRVMRRQDLTKKLIMTKTNTKKRQWEIHLESKYKDKDKDNDKDKYIESTFRAILVTCDIWDTDYISDNWELDFLTILLPDN